MFYLEILLFHLFYLRFGLSFNSIAFRSIELKTDSILTGFVGLQQRYDNWFNCLLLCSQIPVCKSINFIPSQSVCHINNEREDGVSVVLSHLSGCIYVDAKDIPKELSMNCINNSCGNDEMCVTSQDGYKCYSLRAFGYSFKPNYCVLMSWESWGWVYKECDIPGIQDGRAVSMLIHVQQSDCISFGSFYNWKHKTVFVDYGCRASFNVCVTVF